MEKRICCEPVDNLGRSPQRTEQHVDNKPNNLILLNISFRLLIADKSSVVNN